MNIVGRSEVRVDAFDKATGRTKYYDDLAPKDALLIRVKHSTIAHGFVKSVDISKAEKIPGVVKILTCFDVPDIPFPTAGHPWSMDPSHQDIADRHLLNQHVRYYGDDVCAVIAEDEVAAMQAVRAIEVEYEELPFVLDVQKAMEPGAPQLHEAFPNNILKHKPQRRAITPRRSKSRASSRSRAGTKRRPCSTATSRITAASAMRKTAASS